MKDAPASSASQSVASYAPSAETLSFSDWQAANWIAVIATTSIAIALVQTPLNSVMINYIKHSQAIPPSIEPRSGFLAAAQTLYAGLGANFAGSGARTAYVTGARKINATEKGEPLGIEDTAHSVSSVREKSRPTKSFFRDFGYVGLISLGDVLVTQVPETKALLINAKVIDKKFNLKTSHNLFKLGATGFFARFSGGLVNFTALCVVEGVYARNMPFDDDRVNHFLAGAASGMTAAIFSYPCSYYRDYLISKAFAEDGKLQVPSALSLVDDLRSHIKKVGLSVTAKQAAKEFAVQAPLKMARTGATFALISGIAAVMGEEPLTIALDKISNVTQSWGSSRFFLKLSTTVAKDSPFGIYDDIEEQDRLKPTTAK
jgi:hypothetical protein